MVEIGDNKVANTKLSGKEWKEKRVDTELGLKSMVQGIGQLLSLGVLVNAEKNQLDTAEMYLKNLISYYETRNEKSKEEYCDRK